MPKTWYTLQHNFDYVAFSLSLSLSFSSLPPLLPHFSPYEALVPSLCTQAYYVVTCIRHYGRVLWCRYRASRILIVMVNMLCMIVSFSRCGHTPSHICSDWLFVHLAISFLYVSQIIQKRTIIFPELGTFVPLWNTSKHAQCHGIPQSTFTDYTCGCCHNDFE